ncbi:MAG: aromatic amino acid lyase [Pikeienuella sp.]
MLFNNWVENRTLDCQLSFKNQSPSIEEFVSIKLGLWIWSSGSDQPKDAHVAITINDLKDFTLEIARNVAWSGVGVRLGKSAISAMRASRDRFETLIEDPELTIYGVTSGYGQNAKTRLTKEQRKAHAKQPPTAPATSWGDPLPDRVTRAIIFARLANFVEGHAAISPPIAEAVAAMLNAPKQPTIPARGQGGAGEILSLSHLFLPMLETVEPAEKDVLSLINGSPAATGLVTDAALAAQRRIKTAAEVLVLAAEAFDAPLEHFDPALDNLWNNPHDASALAQIRDLLAGTNTINRRPYQAPVSFRILPRILGQAHLAASQAEMVARDSLGAVSDNPVVLAADAHHPNGRAISTGGYHNAQAPMVMDQITAAYANLAIIAERMSAKLLDEGIALKSLGPEAMSTANRGYLGCLPMAAAGYAEEARALATATLLPGSESGGFGANDVASPVFAAWSKQERAGVLLESTLAALAPIAVRGFDVTDRPPPPALEELASLIRETVPDEAGATLLGPATGALAKALRERIYAA